MYLDSNSNKKLSNEFCSFDFYNKIILFNRKLKSLNIKNDNKRSNTLLANKQRPNGLHNRRKPDRMEQLTTRLVDRPPQPSHIITRPKRRLLHTTSGLLLYRRLHNQRLDASQELLVRCSHSRLRQRVLFRQRLVGLFTPTNR